MTVRLTYYIFEGVLTGLVENGGNTRLIHISALSGGAGGTEKHKTTSAVNNPYEEGLKTVGEATDPHHVHGGPIPPGTYKIKKPRLNGHLGLSAEIVHSGPWPMGRTPGFFIHSTGPHGSDGCIVPLDKTQFHHLMHQLTASNGGDLVVEETMGGGRFV